LRRTEYTQLHTLREEVADRTLQQRQVELATLIERFTGRDGTHSTAIASLRLHRSSVPNEPIYGIWVPVLCVVAQGSKQVILEDELYAYDPTSYLLVSVDLPLLGQVIKATSEVPYLGLSLELDPGQISALIMEAGLKPALGNLNPGRGLVVSRLSAPLLDAVVRLLRLLETPQDIPVLAPLVQREILYRLLIDEQGVRLHQIASSNSQMQRITRAINWLKRNYAQTLRIEDIAREARMSPSGLHHHFKAVTAMSPLQYQKQLRLQEARRLMLGEDVDAATAGFRVGYESPSQFSREYSRLFGAPPLRDIVRLRSSPNPDAHEDVRAT
jgi:AraC-like DNA-binding protein